MGGDRGKKGQSVCVSSDIIQSEDHLIFVT